MAVAEMPGNWHAVDFSSGYSDTSGAMANLQDVANMILFMSVGATLLIICLVVLLFLSDRKYEFGIYLALGEKKQGIISQVIMELFPLALIAMTLALFVGSALASEISNMLLRQEMMNPAEMSEPLRLHMLELTGYRFALNHEQMIEMYEVNLSIEVILLYYGLGLGVILLAIVMPIMRIVKMNPKKVLL